MSGVAGLILSAGWVGVLIGVLVFNTEAADTTPMRSLFLLIIACMPAVLAGAGLRGHRPAYAAAAIISVPVSLTSFSSATLPLIIPTVFYLAAWAGEPWTRRILLSVATVTASEAMLYIGWPFIDNNDRFPSLRMQALFIAGISIFLVPHALAFLAIKRSWLLLPAGLWGIAVTTLSALSPAMLIATVPLVLFPSLLYLVRFTGESVHAWQKTR